MLPEMRHLSAGLKFADSYIFNPLVDVHQFRLFSLLCQGWEALRTFSACRSLKTATRGQVKDYRDWGVALVQIQGSKLWFVIRSFGLKLAR